MNHFLFIIPLTPQSHLTQQRKLFRELCIETIINQTYKNWTALLIGDAHEKPNDDRLIYIDSNGTKEEKLQLASSYIIQNKVNCDYIIRLDDDDVFNPTILKTLSDKKFDVMVDKYHSFWNPSSALISQKIMYWFANTCVIKKELALSLICLDSGSENENSLVLIANKHHLFHLFFNKQHQIIYTKKSNPLYLRTINADSITFKEANDINDYLNKFGAWKKLNLKSFSFLKSFTIHSISEIVSQSLTFKLREYFNELVALKNYHKIIFESKNE